ncbi:MAG: type II secretion system protein GspL [Gammaproteobacteria bacterium]
MSSAILARVAAGGEYEWIRCAERGAVVERGSAPELASAAGPRSVAVALDGRCVRTLQAVIPARSQRQAEQAAPFAIEEDLAEDPEHLQVACGRAGEGGRRGIAVIRQAVLDEVLGPLAAQGVNVASAFPEFLAVPHRPGHWSLLFDTSRVLVRTGPDQGFACDPVLLERMLARHDPAALPSAVDVFGEGTLPPLLAHLPRHMHPLPRGALGLLAEEGTDTPVLELLPVRFRARAGFRGAGAGWAVGLLALAVVIHAGFLWRDLRTAERALDEVRTAQAALMREAFPEIPKIVNAEVQAFQVVKELGGRRTTVWSALQALHQVGAAMRRDGDAALRLDQFNYADGVANFRVAAPDIAAIEQLRERLEGDVQVDVVRVETRDSGVAGTLRLLPDAAR